MQKIFRGYYSRKYVHNFYLRKAYLDSVAQTGHERRAELAEHFERLHEMETRRMEEELEPFLAAPRLGRLPPADPVKRLPALGGGARPSGLSFL